MYTAYYGLDALPFELAANPAFLYLTPGHSEALSNLEYGLSAAKAVTLLTGEAGTGKTTLLNAALGSDRCRDVSAIALTNPTLLRGEFIDLLARRFGLSHAARESKAVLLEELYRTVLERRSRGEIVALVVDEAQSLSSEILEEIRLLANIETPTAKLLPLVLAGQPELGLRLEDPGLRQLKQRVALRCELSPLTLPQTAAYIASRIETAGGVASRLFSRQAVMLIHEYSKGIPRVISVICDNALTSGFALGKQPIDQQIIREVGTDLRLAGSSGHIPLPEATAPGRRGSASPTAPIPADESGEGAADSPGGRLRAIAATRR